MKKLSQRISKRLTKEYKEEQLKKKQDACSHEQTYKTNHGYHEYCYDCGLDLPWNQK